MRFAPRGLGSLLTGLSVALLIVVPSGLGPSAVHDMAAVVAPALANEPIDALSTGSIAPAVRANLAPYVPVLVTMSPLPLAQPEPPRAGSAEFQKALGVVSDDPARAFELAGELASSAERRTVQWAAMYSGNGKVDADAVLKFSAEAPDFIDPEVLRMRVEQALLRTGSDPDRVVELLGGAMPTTLEAQIALALAYVAHGQKERAAGIARQIWTTEFLDKPREDRVYKKLGELLTAEDHWARAVHLMMHDRTKATDRLLPFLTDAQKSLIKARSAVSRDAKDAKKLLDAVDPSMQTHPVYLYSRAQRAREAKLWDEAIGWLDKATGDLPDPAEWWYERRRLSDALLALGKTDLAYTAAAGFTEGPEGRVVEAQFRAGWIALSFKQDAKAAVGHFEAMLDQATLSESVAQAYYWIGRAKLALDDKLGANEAFGLGARYRTIYYGLLSRAELGMSGVQLKDMPDQTVVADAFEASDVVQGIRLLAANGRDDLALTLLRSYAFRVDDAGKLLLTAELADDIGAPSLAIKIAEDADKRGMPLDLLAFPKDRLPVTHVAEIDHAAIYAITRQESHFQLDAVSSSGARGLMQLMPGTARETAKKVGVEYSKSRLLTDGAYNALLGSTYLASQLDRYDGSLTLAAAAYNAGPGNANKWIKAFGDPRDPAVDPVVWVERIPLQETRTYVKRVLGNYLVYRSQLGRDDISMLEALRRIR